MENDVPLELDNVKSSLSNYNVAENELPRELIKFGCKILLLVANFLSLQVDRVTHFGIKKYLDFFKEIAVPVRKMLTSYQEYGLVID